MHKSDKAKPKAGKRDENHESSFQRLKVFPKNGNDKKNEVEKEQLIILREPRNLNCKERSKERPNKKVAREPVQDLDDLEEEVQSDILSSKSSKKKMKQQGIGAEMLSEGSGLDSIASSASKYVARQEKVD